MFSFHVLQGLVVPVIRNVENMNYKDIEIAVNALGEKVIEHVDNINNKFDAQSSEIEMFRCLR